MGKLFIGVGIFHGGRFSRGFLREPFSIQAFPRSVKMHKFTVIMQV